MSDGRSLRVNSAMRLMPACLQIAILGPGVLSGRLSSKSAARRYVCACRVPSLREMHYFEFDPAPLISTHIASYWGMTVASHVPANHPHELIPDGCVVVACRSDAQGAPRASLVGPRAEPLTVSVNPGDRFWGVRFWPDSASALLHADPRTLRGKLVAPLLEPPWLAGLTRALVACDDESSAARVADEHLAAPVAAARPLDPIVRAAVVALVVTRGEIEIEELARDVGVSRRQLERRFGAAVGLTPKQFARIRRLRSALAHLLHPAPRTWSEVAADVGYADHAHLTRDFTLLVGLTPSEIAERVRGIVHGRVRP